MKKLESLLSLLTILLVAVCFSTVVLRYLFNWVFIPLQEMIIYLHATVFMLGVIYCFDKNRHVKIDIFQQNYSESKKDKTQFFGTIFLLIPTFIFMFYASYDYVFSSWSRIEGSAETGGLPLVFLLKTLLLILPVFIILVAIKKIVRKV